MIINFDLKVNQLSTKLYCIAALSSFYPTEELKKEHEKRSRVLIFLKREEKYF
jgi:hypothetical protein